MGCPVPADPQRSLCPPGLGGLFHTQGMKKTCRFGASIRQTLPGRLRWARLGRQSGAGGELRSEACPLGLAKRSLALVSPSQAWGMWPQQQEGVGPARPGPSEPPAMWFHHRPLLRPGLCWVSWSLLVAGPRSCLAWGRKGLPGNGQCVLGPCPAVEFRVSPRGSTFSGPGGGTGQGCLGLPR